MHVQNQCRLFPFILFYFILIFIPFDVIKETFIMYKALFGTETLFVPRTFFILILFILLYSN